MNYCEALLLIQERGEKFLGQDSRCMITDKHRYLRDNGVWTEDTEPGTPERRFSRGGENWVWNRTEVNPPTITEVVT
jgi:hypothetical protein